MQSTRIVIQLNFLFQMWINKKVHEKKRANCLPIVLVDSQSCHRAELPDCRKKSGSLFADKKPFHEFFVTNTVTPLSASVGFKNGFPDDVLLNLMDFYVSIRGVRKNG